MSEDNDKKRETVRFGLTQPEYDNLLDMLRYGGIIVLAVMVTLVIVAIGANLLG
jgi:hypothetical protein